MRGILIKVKVKVPLGISSHLCSTLGGGAHPRFQAVEPTFVRRQFPWSHGQCDLDTERRYLPTEVVPINLLAFACFRTATLVGAGTSDGRLLRHVDSILQLKIYRPYSTEASAV